MLLYMADVENLTFHASDIPWGYKKSYVLDRTMRQKVPSARNRSNNILHSNSSNETNLTVVIENATTTNKILLTVPHCNKIDPLKRFLQLAACVLFRNKISLKEYQMQLPKSLCNNGATYHLARIAGSDPC